MATLVEIKEIVGLGHNQCHHDNEAIVDVCVCVCVRAPCVCARVCAHVRVCARVRVCTHRGEKARAREKFSFFLCKQ